MTKIVKSRERVINHGEVLTPQWLVNAMLDLVTSETERIDSRFLEPACGTGNFLAEIPRRAFSTRAANPACSCARSPSGWTMDWKPTPMSSSIPITRRRSST